MTAWTTPATYAAAQVLTAANLNTYLRDNVTHLKENLDLATTQINLEGTHIGASAPSSPVEGQLWWDTTNKALKEYTTASTGWRAPWNLPWGKMAQAVDATARNSSINNAVSQAVFPTLSFTPLTNRLLSVQWHASRVKCQGLNGETLQVSLCDQAGTVQQWLAIEVSGGAAWEKAMNSMTIGAWATGSVTSLHVRAMNSGTTAVTFQYATYGAYLLIEDIGPNGNPP